MRIKLSKASRGGAAGRKPRAVTLAPDPWATRPDTAAQRAGTVVRDVAWTDPETGNRRNPNAIRGIYRKPLLERMRDGGTFDARQFSAASHIRDAYEATQTGAPAINPIQVDSSPNPAAIIAAQTDRMSKLSAAMRAVPSSAVSLVVHVCCDGRPISAHNSVSGGNSQAAATVALCAALDAVAVAFGL